MGQTIYYGCYCDLEGDQKPDNCVLDAGAITDCCHAIELNGRDRRFCKYWKPVDHLNEAKGGWVVDLDEIIKVLEEKQCEWCSMPSNLYTNGVINGVITGINIAIQVINSRQKTNPSEDGFVKE